MNNDKLEKVRQSLSKTIDEFKESVLGSLPKEGPLHESLRKDVVEESSPQETIPLVKAIKGKDTGIMARAEVEEWVNENIPVPETITIPYADVSIKTPKTVLKAPGTFAFCAGLDNQINSQVRVFFQKMGVSTFLPTGKGSGRYSIVEEYAKENFNFAVVILSADAYVFQKSQNSLNSLLMTDQSTVFELGFLIGKLGRNRVVVIYEPNDQYKRPTEYFDVLYTSYDPDGHWQEKIIRQMRSCGIQIHEEQIVQ
jgi:hypothetical protein